MTTGPTSNLDARASDAGGPSAVEYALMVSLIAVVVVAAVTYVATQARSAFDTDGAAVGP